MSKKLGVSGAFAGRDLENSLVHVFHYVPDEVIEAFQARWEAWSKERGILIKVAAGSGSWTGHRPLSFGFKTSEEAALFRLFFGGTLELRFSPTLSADDL